MCNFCHFKNQIIMPMPMISRSSGGMLAFLLRDASSTPTWCRVRHWWVMIGDPGKPGLDP
ncbi:hypothetical protein Hanom_Chr16g01506731 [Helianthus anomalus]